MTWYARDHVNMWEATPFPMKNYLEGGSKAEQSVQQGSRKMRATRVLDALERAANRNRLYEAIVAWDVVVNQWSRRGHEATERGKGGTEDRRCKERVQSGSNSDWGKERAGGRDTDN